MIRGMDGIRAILERDDGNRVPAMSVCGNADWRESSGEMAYEIGSANFSMPDGKGGKNARVREIHGRVQASGRWHACALLPTSSI